MNILASWNWLNELVDLKGLTPDAVAARVSLSGPGIEKLIPQGKDLDQVVVGRIQSIEPHPNADKLRVTKVDVGGSVATIVCGGSNIAEGQWVAVAKIGAKVRWHGEGELIELAPIDIRGVASEGMICAANEIGLAEAFPHGDREILDLGKELPAQVWKEGTSLADALELSDVLLDTEITTNRPDAMGMFGFAREVAVIMERRLTLPTSQVIEAGTEPLTVSVAGERDGKPLCSRFMAVKIDGVTVGPSPWWLKRRLLAAGHRPMNTLVDITNYLVLEHAQPMHVYDAAKVQGALRAAPVERQTQLLGLDGQTYTLEPGMLAIHDDTGPIGIAGIMGGASTAVSASTTSVIFEAATFDDVSIRRTARALNLSTDASKAFERGLSSEAPLDALARAVELCQALAGGAVVSQVADAQPRAYEPARFSITEAQAQSIMGIPMDGATMQAILERLGFEVVRAGGVLTATVPWWRDHDIEDGRDLVEEIARVYGYANMPPVFPAGMSPVPSHPSFAFATRLRRLLKGFGATETMGYSFVSRQELEKTGLPAEKALKLQNPLSQDHEFMRPSLIPSMLAAVVENQERVHALRLFELSCVYHWNPSQAPLPEERERLAMALVSGDTVWAEAKGMAEALLGELGIMGGSWSRIEQESLWHPGRSIQYVLNGDVLVRAGELHPKMAEAWKIDVRVGLVDGDVEALARYAASAKAYHPLPQFPGVERDLALVVDERVTIGSIQSLLLTKLDHAGLLRDVTWFDTYRGKGLEEGKKSEAFHLVFRADDRTLSSEEVDALMAQATELAKQELGAVIRG